MHRPTPRIASFGLLSALVSFLSAMPLGSAQAETVIFPPNMSPPASSITSGECALTYLQGASSTYCRTWNQMLNFTVPNVAAGQSILNTAMPTCSANQYVAYNGTSFVCQPIPKPPTCNGTGQYLQSDGTKFICATISYPICTGATPYLVSKDGVTLTCMAECVPQNVVVSTGACSADCGGGTQPVNWSDGCGNTWQTSQSCNMSACPVPPVPGNASYYTPGTYVFTVPDYATSLTVQVWGGGAGGQGCGVVFGIPICSGGGSGGNSSFNGGIIAYGGTNPNGGGASGGQTNLAGGNGQGDCAAGGYSPNGGGSGAFPGGGGPGYCFGWGASAGGGGGYAATVYSVGDLTPGTDISVVVGGSGGSNPAGAAGGGEVYINWQ